MKRQRKYLLTRVIWKLNKFPPLYKRRMPDIYCHSLSKIRAYLCKLKQALCVKLRIQLVVFIIHTFDYHLCAVK